MDGVSMRIMLLRNLEALRRTRHRDNVRAARDDPGDGKLSGRNTFLVRDDLHGINKGHVVLEVLFLKPTERTAHVTG